MQTHTFSTLFASLSHATVSSPSFVTPSPGAQELRLINLFFPPTFLFSLFLCYGESQYQSIKSSLGSEGLRSHECCNGRAGRYDGIYHETVEVTLLFRLYCHYINMNINIYCTYTYQYKSISSMQTTYCMQCYSDIKLHILLYLYHKNLGHTAHPYANANRSQKSSRKSSICDLLSHAHVPWKRAAEVLFTRAGIVCITQIKPPVHPINRVGCTQTSLHDRAIMWWQNAVTFSMHKKKKDMSHQLVLDWCY